MTHLSGFFPTIFCGLLALLCLPGHGQDAQAESVAFEQTFATSWIGNTFSEGTKLWMPDWQRGLAVTPDGTVYIAGGAEMFGAAWLRWDAAAGKPRMLGRGGWSWDNGRCAAADARGFWVGGDKKGLSLFPLAPTDPEGQAKPAATLIKEGLITGVAVIGDEVFAIDATLGKLRVFDVVKLTELRSWDIPKEAYHLTADDRGRLWTVIRTHAKDWVGSSYYGGHIGAVVRAWNTDGTDPGLQLEGLDEPRTVAWDGVAKRLLVGLAGTSNQVLLVDVSGAQPKVAGTFGVKGGYMSEPVGRMGPLRFGAIIALAVDAHGNRYISCKYTQGTSNVDCYAPDGKRLWFAYNNGFCEGAVVDPQDETTVYNSRNRFRMDWSKTTPGSEATWEAVTHDPTRWPDEGRSTRFTEPMALLHIGGKPILIYSFQTGGFWACRFEGEIAVPCASWSTLHTRWDAGHGAPVGFPKDKHWNNWLQTFWLDRNGDGLSTGQPEEFAPPIEPRAGGNYSVAADGSIWSLGQIGWDPNKPELVRIPCHGLDERGVPRWDLGQRQEFPLPPGQGLDKAMRVSHDDTDGDALYFMANVDGAIHLSRWNGFPAGKPVRAWESGPIPYKDTAHTPGLGYGGGLPKAIRQAGKYLFIAYGWQALVSIWDKETGCYVGTLTPVGIPPNYDGCLDAEYGHSAFMRKNGEYVVFAETAGCGRVNLYRWRPHANLVGTNGLTATADPHEPAIALAWGAAPGVERWRLERQGGVDGDWRQIAELPAKTLAWRDTGLWAGTVYSYRLLAVKGAYTSAPSFVAYDSTMEPDLVTGEHIGASPATAPAVDGAIQTAVSEKDVKKADWVGIDAGKPVVATRVRLMPADIFQGSGALSGGRIQGAASPEGPWTDLSRELQDMPTRQWTDVPLRAPATAEEETLGVKPTTPAAFRCFRFLARQGRPAAVAEMRVVTSDLPTLRLLPREIQAVQPGKELALSIETTAELARVDYTLDGRPIGSADKPPFRLRWKAPDEAGARSLRAIAVTKRGLAGTSEPTIVHTPGKVVLRRNAQGPDIPGWSVDGEMTFSQGGTYETAKPIDLAGAVDPAPEAVYRTARWDPRVISIPGLVPHRAYVVRLHFADIDGGHAAAGQRLFNISIAYQRMIPTIDVAGEAGGPYRALTRTFIATADRFGALEIHVDITRDSRPHRAILNGLELIDPQGQPQGQLR